MASREDDNGAKTPPGEVTPPAGSVTAVTVSRGGGGRRPPPPEPPPSGDDEEGMLRMSFLEHLSELRSRIIKMVMGVLVAVLLSLTFCNQLWRLIAQPAVEALTHLGIKPPTLKAITPMEQFNVIWVKLPFLCALFIAAPWIVYQVWAFISPGLYKRERRYAVPFILCSAGLFIGGGAFAYFIAFRFALTFLLGIGMGNYVDPMVSISEYFDLFVNVTLGVGLVFEMPILIFFLTLLRVVSPAFLVKHSRYAILGIFIIAAIVTPTPDAFNMLLFALPMCLLFYVGVFAGYLLVLKREGRRFPWGKVLTIIAIVLVIFSGLIYLAALHYKLHPVPHWPFLHR
ncbi:MAG TPA: twin-arginine translocase subunit TatC [Bryobacteraceae bacterium]|jgi:sec-independent protein translocase protein TatC|nr:twin-arginine translocase subunit TatC [Bryobacteraceae bacterium]